MTTQAVQTRFIGPTNSRGSRVRAFSEAFPRGVTVSWDYALNSVDNHDAAARAFIVKHEWFGTWIRGGSADGRGNVYVCALTERNEDYRTPCERCAEPRDLLIVRKEGGES